MSKNKGVLEKGRISVLQLLLLNITFIISTADVFPPAFVAQDASQDSWLSVIFGTASALLMINVMISLSLRYPNKTIVQYACDIVGKPLGKVIGALYVYFYFHVNHVVSRELGEIFVTSFNPTSPVALYVILIMPVAAYAVYKGLEVIARLNEILLPVGIFVLILIGIINIPKMNLMYFLPILYNGIYPVIKGGIVIQTWILETFIVLQLIPFVKEKQSIRKYINGSVVFLGLGLQVGVLTIAVMGPLTGSFLLPALTFVKYASIGQYINNLDISIMVVWVSGIFIKISLAYYLTVLSLSQLFEFKTMKPIIVPVGIISICFAIAAVANIPDLLFSLHYILPFYMLTMTFIIPAILLAIALVKDKLSQLNKDTATEPSINEQGVS